VNSDSREAGAYIAPDERFIIFESNRPGGIGGTDLYISFRQGSSWAQPRRLDAPINSPAQETSAILSPDGKVLYFASSRKSPDAVRLGAGMRYEQILRGLRSPGNGRWHTYFVSADPAIFEAGP
jgi:hypothetical protein